jgi:protein-S-isoprenylcysteine O-methyltransferase Ste14
VDVDHLFGCLILGTLGCLAGLGITRGVMLSARGVRIFPIDRERTIREGLADLAFLLCFIFWLYETLAFALPLDFHLVPAPVRVLLIDAIAAKVLGALAMTAGIAVYGLALRAFGSSWRLGIDRDRPGPLVTGGIFCRSRNPIYLSLMLLEVGVFLGVGRLVLLLLAISSAAYFHFLVRREERFLVQHYGDAYRVYTQRVGRWWTIGAGYGEPSGREV